MFLTNQIFIENNWPSFDNQSNIKYRDEGLLLRMDDSLLSRML